jgi:CCR4-NOT transcriptional regulation complex NOT5 subunit
LTLQKDQFEAEIESLLAGKKKKLDKDKQDRMDKLKDLLEKHRFHIRNMEILLRMLDNMSVEVEQVYHYFHLFHICIIQYCFNVPFITPGYIVSLM